LDGNKFIVYIDYKAIIDTSKNLDLIYKKSPRLINWRLFLAKYPLDIDI